MRGDQQLRLHHACIAHVVDMVNRFCGEDKHILRADGQVRTSYKHRYTWYIDMNVPCESGIRYPSLLAMLNRKQQKSKMSVMLCHIHVQTHLYIVFTCLYNSHICMYMCDRCIYVYINLTCTFFSVSLLAPSPDAGSLPPLQMILCLCLCLCVSVPVCFCVSSALSESVCVFCLCLFVCVCVWVRICVSGCACDCHV
jgi:hypothetical protein